ncbi:MAG: glycosyltransferase [Propionibacteriaceae bacterium]
MRLMILTAGSRGDVEPFAVLAREAVRRGHQVRLAVPDHSGVDLSGLDVVSLGVDFARLVSGQGVSPWAAARAFTSTVRPMMRTLFVTAVQRCLEFEPDVIVHHPKVLSADLAARRLGVPRVLVELTPSVTATRDFPAPGVVDVDLGPLNRMTYLASAASARMFASELEAAARAAGLTESARAGAAQTTLVPISRHLLPRPADWPDSVHLTGAWQDARPAALDPAVEEFIWRGPFLYAGFGSMAAGDPVARAETIVAAARARSLGTLLLTGWGGLELPDHLRGDDVLALPSLPHEQVLPLAYAALHHGGAGTVHAAARAGTVSLVLPFVADQPFWGRLLHRDGLAPRPLSRRRLTVARLGHALDQVEDYRPAAHTISEQLMSEHGVTSACELLESITSRFTPQHHRTSSLTHGKEGHE